MDECAALHNASHTPHTDPELLKAACHDPRSAS